MCLAAAPAAVAIAASQAGLQYYQQSEQAKIQQKFADANATNSSRSAALSYAAIQQRTHAESLRAGAAIKKVRRDSASAQGTAVALAAEGGVGGRSVDMLLDDFARQEGEFVDATLINEELARYNAALEAQQIQLGQHGRLLASAAPPAPDPFAAIAGAGIGGYTAYQQAELLESRIESSN